MLYICGWCPEILFHSLMASLLGWFLCPNLSVCEPQSVSALWSVVLFLCSNLCLSLHSPECEHCCTPCLFDWCLYSNLSLPLCSPGTRCAWSSLPQFVLCPHLSLILYSPVGKYLLLASFHILTCPSLMLSSGWVPVTHLVCFHILKSYPLHFLGCECPSLIQLVSYPDLFLPLCPLGCKCLLLTWFVSVSSLPLSLHPLGSECPSLILFISIYWLVHPSTL